MEVPREIASLVRDQGLSLPLLVRAGSRSYGLEIEGSDDDFVGVFVAPLRRFVSLFGLDSLTLTGLKPDFTLHEIGKFCRLALKGNPAILETLWNPDVVARDGFGDELVAMRRAFLHRESLRVYAAYAESQMKKMMAGKGLHAKGGSYNPKYGAHLLRLLEAGIELGRTGEVVVRVARPENLLRVRRGELTMGEVLDCARPLLRELEALSEENALPPKPDVDRIDDFVARARLAWNS